MAETIHTLEEYGLIADVHVIIVYSAGSFAGATAGYASRSSMSEVVIAMASRAGFEERLPTTPVPSPTRLANDTDDF